MVGDLEKATFGDYFSHALSFFWNVLFAFVPPTSIAGGWLTFIISLVFIALLTAVVGDVAAIFGCLVGLKDSITAIFICCTWNIITGYICIDVRSKTIENRR